MTWTTVRVPRDYRQPRGASFQLFVAKSPATDQANKIGSLFINLGGPGGTAADFFEGQGAGLFPGLNARFDIIAMDPRGVGQSQLEGRQRPAETLAPAEEIWTLRSGEPERQPEPVG